MSLALESSRMEGPGFIRGMSCMPIFSSDLPEPGKSVAGISHGQNRRFPVQKDEELSASCSSSIGRDSDSGGLSVSDGEDSGEMEVQSSYKGPLDTMDALEESLPIRRSISKFYCGKSKSFTSLADASSSATDLAKPENSYSRKRKNLFAFNNTWERNHRFFPPVNSSSGISKRPMNSSRSTLALAVAMSSSESNTSDEQELRLPPLHPQMKSSSNASPPQWSRSFSLTDLPGASSSTSPRDKTKKIH